MTDQVLQLTTSIRSGFPNSQVSAQVEAMVYKIPTCSRENYKLRLIIIEFAGRQLQRRVRAGKLYFVGSSTGGLVHTVECVSANGFNPSFIGECVRFQ